MNRLLPISLILGLGFLGCANSKDPLETAMRSLVKVQTYQHETDRTTVCGGFIVSASEGKALTAAHCVSTNPDDQVYVDGKLSKVLKINESLALVSVEKMVKPPIDIHKGALKYGDPTWSVGYGYNMLLVLRDYVAGFVHGDLILGKGFPNGMSGGISVDVEGKAVGVSQATDGYTTVVCGPDEIRDFLNSK